MKRFYRAHILVQLFYALFLSVLSITIGEHQSYADDLQTHSNEQEKNVSHDLFSKEVNFDQARMQLSPFTAKTTISLPQEFEQDIQDKSFRQQVANSLQNGLLSKETIYSIIQRKFRISASSNPGKALRVNLLSSKKSVPFFERRPRKLYQHLRGEEGVALSYPDEDLQGKLFARYRSENPAQELKSVPKANQLSSPGEHSRRAMEFFTPGPIETCRKSYTKKLKQKLSENKEFVQGKTYVDLLILPEGVPTSIARNRISLEPYFGQSTRVLSYSREAGQIFFRELEKGGAPCLPIRFRMVGKDRYLHLGKDALKNFGQTLKGTIHPAIERRLHEIL